MDSLFLAAPSLLNAMHTQTTSSERVIWQGYSSQLVNFWWFVLALFVLPIPWTIKKWLEIKCRTYEITTERVLAWEGIFSARTDSIALDHVQDITLIEPLLYRPFRRGHIVLNASDRTSPPFRLSAVASPRTVCDELWTAMEQRHLQNEASPVVSSEGNGGEFWSRRTDDS